MGSKRGRRPTIALDQLQKVLNDHKSDIVKENNTIASKEDSIWTTISKKLDNVVNPKSIHSLVACNRHNIRSELMPSFNNDTTAYAEEVNSTLESTQNVSIESDCSDNLASQREDSHNFTFTVNREEFQKLILNQTYQRRTGLRKGSYQRNILKPGQWQNLVTSKIWETTHRKCGYNYKQHFVSLDKTKGSIQGHCHCSSKLKIKFSTLLDDVIFSCNATIGDGTCKKTYLRKPKRVDVAKTLQTITTHGYRTKQANELMNPGDPEPPHLPKSQVLQTAKAEYRSTLYYDRDPITAISIMHKIYPETIHYLSEIDVCVHIWTSHQRDVYLKYASRDKNTCLYIDATGGIFPKFIKRNKTKTKSLFLYIIAARFAGEQFTVGQMISDSHTTFTISTFLHNWLAYGFPAPSEIVMDSSMALLNATVETFTCYKTVYQYANAFLNNDLPTCYIRLDVAHFIRLYAETLKPSPQLVRVFFLACLGKLICMTDENEARSWIKAIFILALSQRTGLLSSGEESASLKAKNKLQSGITGTPHEEEAEEVDQKIQEINDTDSSNSESSDEDETLEPEKSKKNKDESTKAKPSKGDKDDGVIRTKSNNKKPKYKDDLLIIDTSEDSSWSLWGEVIFKEAEAESNDKGDSINPLYHLKVANKLKKDIKLIVLWSCIVQPKFKRGRIPASSSSVECEVKLFKNSAFHNQKRRMDQGAEDVIKYIQGRAKLVDAGIQVEMETVAQNLQDLVQDGIDAQDNDHNIDSSNSIDVSINNGDNTEHTNQEDNNNENSKFACEACARGDIPTGIHQCLRCNKAVHILDSCSSRVEGQEEGYGEWRLCNTCQLLGKKSNDEFVATKQFENWRGQGNPESHSKSRSKYLNNQSHIIKDKLLYDKSVGIPIIKNGGSRNVKAVNLDKRTISFFNTCPFDSILQLLLAGASDYPIMEQKINDNDQNPIFSLVLQILKDKKITANTYRLRGRILLQYFDPKKASNKKIVAGVESINCLSNAAGFAAQLFRNTPSLVEFSECKNKCLKKRTSIPVINVKAESLTGNFDRVFQDYVFFERSCVAPDCAERTKVVEWTLGVVTIFEPYWLTNDSVIMKLKSIPKEINTEGKKLRLIGIIEYVAETIASRRSHDKKEVKEDSEVGHYYAISYRRDGQWIIYDDCRDKPIRVKENTEAHINAIFYAQI